MDRLKTMRPVFACHVEAVQASCSYRFSFSNEHHQVTKLDFAKGSRDVVHGVHVVQVSTARNTESMLQVQAT